MPAPYSAKAVANAFLNRAFASKKNIDPLKIQKLVYYASGYYLAATGVPLIDEAFEAWDKGPVVPSLYHEFKQFGYSPIRTLAEEIDWDDEGPIPVPPPQSDRRADKIIDFVWDRYGKRSSIELSELTHVEDGPWDRTRKNNKFHIKNKDIPDAFIEEYFSRLIKRK